jgi:CRISPR/Cas system-associated protein Cas10 (large subunit of type III CRISPR-Cas system)
MAKKPFWVNRGDGVLENINVPLRHRVKNEPTDIAYHHIVVRLAKRYCPICKREMDDYDNPCDEVRHFCDYCKIIVTIVKIDEF